MNNFIKVLSLCLVCDLFFPTVKAEIRIKDAFNPEVDSIFYRDLGIVDVRPDTINAGEGLAVEVDVRNYGEVTETFEVIIGWWGPNHSYYEDSYLVELNPGLTVTVQSDSFLCSIDSGDFPVRCTIPFNDSNPNNNGGIYIIYVRPSQFIKEMNIPIVDNQTNELNTRIMTITQFRSQILTPKSGMEIYKVNGKRIAPERISPGIYFVKTNQTRKIVIIE
ncbi:MAG: hypothetical protein OEZ20_02320 [candidate division WOR-3 bacterium]|nr:hypothetical protein [candidate division WOR-3 bacterium]MDH5683281.1 hypothetical protein [candidate division WOR-3 bacterium]